MKIRSARARLGVSAVAFLLALALVVAGCGGGGSSGVGGGGVGGGSTSGGGGNGGESEAAAKPGGTLTIADYAEPITLNPAIIQDILSSHVAEQIVEPLFKANAESKVEPWLAESMQASNGDKTFTITLRKGVKFSNGKPMTAADVVFTLDNIRKSPVWSILFEAIENVSETSPDTVVIKTSKPTAKLEGTLTLAFAGIIPKNFAGESEKEFANHPIGTGPFELVSWKRGSALTLQKNPHYWKPGLPLLDKVVFKMLPDVNTRTSELRAGEVDAISSPDWSQLSSLEADPNLKVGLYKAAILDLLALNVEKPLFQNPKVREAVNLAIDREGIVKAALYGHGETAGSFVPPGIEDHDPAIKAPKQDVAKAKELLAEAVQEDGIEPEFQLIFLQGETFTATVSQIIQSNLEEAGFKVSLQALDESAEISQGEEGRFDAGLSILTNVIVDPTESTAFYVATEGLFTRVNTDKLAKLSSEASSAANESERRQRYYEAQEVVNEQYATIMLDSRPLAWAMQSDVTGFQVGVANELRLAETGFSQ